MALQLMYLVFIGLLSLQPTPQKFILQQQESQLEILGTSTLHDWEVMAEEINGEASMETGAHLKIHKLHFSVKVKSLESGKNAMNKNMYVALKADKNPFIIYNLAEVKSQSKTGDTERLQATGKLMIGGFEKNITLPVTVRYKDSEVAFSGDATFKMSDYNIEPPTALMGTIKTGDEITVKFNVIYRIN